MTFQIKLRYRMGENESAQETPGKQSDVRRRVQSESWDVCLPPSKPNYLSVDVFELRRQSACSLTFTAAPKGGVLRGSTWDPRSYSTLQQVIWTK